MKVGEVTGIVLAVSPDGSTRVLSEGDVLQPGETVHSGQGSSASLQGNDGQVVSVTANMKLSVPSNVAMGGSSSAGFTETSNAVVEKQAAPEVNEAVTPVDSESPPKEDQSTEEGELESAPDLAATPEVLSNELPGNLDAAPLLIPDNQTEYAFLQSPLSGDGYAGKELGEKAGTPLTPNPIVIPDYVGESKQEAEPVATIGGTQVMTVITPQVPEPGPEPEPPSVHENASAAADSAQVVFGETLTQQDGILLNDTGTGIALDTVKGVSVSDSGPTTITGDHGTLTIQPDGSYSYVANDRDLDLDSGLVAYWGFNQPTSSTSVEDQSKVDQVSDNGVLSGQAAIVENGFSGNALSLDGRGDHVSINNPNPSASDYDYTEQTPASFNPEVSNDNFSDGTFQGWTGWGIDVPGTNRLSVYSNGTAYKNIETSNEDVNTYTITFTLYQYWGGAGTVHVDWGGERAASFSLPSLPLGQSVVTQETITVNATGDPLTQLRFNRAGAIYSIDNVVVTAHPNENAAFNETAAEATVFEGALESSGGDIDARTISFAFKPGEDNSLDNRQVLYTEGGGNGGFIVYVENNTLYAGAHNGADWSGEYLSKDISSLDASEWQSIALTLDGDAGTLEAFLNGESFGQSDSAQSIQGALDGALIGTSGSINKYHDGVQTGSFDFDGMIDEVRVYDRVLSDEEVNALAASDTIVDSFDYTIVDAEGGTSDASLNIQLNAPTDNAPVAADDVLVVMSDQGIAVNSSVSIGLLANDGDLEGSSLSVTQVNGFDVDQYGTTNVAGTYGTLTIAPDGTYSYSPLYTAIAGGVDTFSYTVSDGTTTSTANLNVTVIADDFANADSATVIESALPPGSLYVLDDVEGSNDVHLNVVNAETGVTNKLGALSVSMEAIAMSPTGVLYGADATNLYAINPATLVAAEVGAHGLSGSINITGLTFSPDGTLYAGGNDGDVFRIDTSTGLPTNIGNVSSAGQESLLGDIVWHDGSLYAQAYKSSPQGYTFVKIDVVGDSAVIRALPDTVDSTPLHSLASIDGQLTGVVQNSYSPTVVSVDTETGAIKEWKGSTGIHDAQDATSIEQLVQGNVLSNDNGGSAVTAVALPDGTSRTVGSEGVTLQGTYGTLTLSTNGSYSYNINNSLDATNNLASGETGNDRFVYTATNADGDTSQSILTVYVNGADEVQTTEHAIFSDYAAVDMIDTSASSAPIDFEVSVQNDTDRITEIRIAKPYSSTFTIPDEWTDNGTVTGNTSSSHEVVWTVTPGAHAGLESINAVDDGLTISPPAEGRINISVTTSEYDGGGNISGNWTSTSALSINLVSIENERSGGAGTDILGGTADNDSISGGGGSDVLTGGDNQDFFIWHASDAGTENNPAVDTITDFHTGLHGDVLDLRDLLPDDASDKLDEFLSFSFESGDTTIDVSTTEGGPVVQSIVLDGVDLSATYGTADVTQLTNQLTDNGNLLS